MHDPEAARFGSRHFETSDSDVRAPLHMLLQHEFVIHLVDMIPGEKHDEPSSMRLYDIDVLINGVGRPEIPICLRNALAGRQNVEALIALRAKEIPAHLQMSNQAVGLVLGGDRDPAN